MKGKILSTGLASSSPTVERALSDGIVLMLVLVLQFLFSDTDGRIPEAFQ